METEEKIVYSIITTINKQRNEDDKIGERAIRAFVQQYRTALINDYSNNGIEVSEECFQDLGEVYLSRVTNGGREHNVKLPKIVRMKENYGLIVEKNGYRIPVVTSQDYRLGMTSLLSKYHPKAKFLGEYLTLYIGKKKPDCAHADELNALVDDFETEADGVVQKGVSLSIFAVLDNPNDCPTYDWTTSPYPANSELIRDIKAQVLAREFNIILQVHQDKVTNIDDESIKE